jgi:YfiH family protein
VSQVLTDSRSCPSELLEIHWPAPARVRSFCTTRIGGSSAAPFDALNLSTASGDAEQRVCENVAHLHRVANLPHSPRWPTQVHGTLAIDAEVLDRTDIALKADALFTCTSGQLCTVRTADCLPVLFCDRAATTVAAAHAGWRGLAAGVLEATIGAMPCRAEQLLAWLGPAIGPAAYEVGPEVRAAFLAHDAHASRAFTPAAAQSPSATRTGAQQHWLADLYELARQRLRAAGVTDIYGGGLCTFADPARFFSYRRDGVTGRMACGIWLSQD